MERITAPPLPEGCPWSDFTPPNVDWCEAELCAWITNPANTWSNLAYLVVGLWMWRAARRADRPGLALFGPAAIFVGLCSAIYHASYTYVLQILDFVGMYVFVFLLIAQNARRLGWIRAGREILVLGGGVALFTALIPPLFERGIPIQGLVALLIGAAIAQEVALARRAPTRTTTPSPYGWYAAALALLTAGSVCSALDVTRVWCDPNDHVLQGHAAWHVLSAASLGALFAFYARLPGTNGAAARR